MFPVTVIKMSEMISTSSLHMFLVHCQRGPGMLSGPAALLTFTLSRIPLKSTVDTDSGPSSQGGVLTADSLLRRSKRA